jgi:hypothetical protein
MYAYVELVGLLAVNMIAAACATGNLCASTSNLQELLCKFYLHSTHLWWLAAAAQLLVLQALLDGTFHSRPDQACRPAA